MKNRIPRLLEKRTNTTRLIDIGYEDESVSGYMCISCRDIISSRSNAFDFHYCPYCGRQIVGCMWTPKKKEYDYESPEYKIRARLREMNCRQRVDETQKYYYEVWVYEKDFFGHDNEMSHREKCELPFKNCEKWMTDLNIDSDETFKNGRKRSKRIDFEFDKNYELAQKFTQERYSMMKALAQYRWLLRYIPQESDRGWICREEWKRVCIVRKNINLSSYDQELPENIKIVREHIIILYETEKDDTD